MRAFEIFRRSHRRSVLKRTGDPDMSLSTTKRKKFAGSYSDIMKLPSGGTVDLQDPVTGKLNHLLDYDPLP